MVIGAGHAGIEAACAAAKLGAKTALFTLTLDGIGNLPCRRSQTRFIWRKRTPTQGFWQMSASSLPPAQHRLRLRTRWRL